MTFQGSGRTTVPVIPLTTIGALPFAIEEIERRTNKGAEMKPTTWSSKEDKGDLGQSLPADNAELVGVPANGVVGQEVLERVFESAFAPRHTEGADKLSRPVQGQPGKSSAFRWDVNRWAEVPRSRSGGPKGQGSAGFPQVRSRMLARPPRPIPRERALPGREDRRGQAEALARRDPFFLTQRPFPGLVSRFPKPCHPMMGPEGAPSASTWHPPRPGRPAFTKPGGPALAGPKTGWPCHSEWGDVRRMPPCRSPAVRPAGRLGDLGAANFGQRPNRKVVRSVRTPRCCAPPPHCSRCRVFRGGQRRDPGVIGNRPGSWRRRDEAAEGCLSEGSRRGFRSACQGYHALRNLGP